MSNALQGLVKLAVERVVAREAKACAPGGGAAPAAESASGRPSTFVFASAPIARDAATSGATAQALVPPPAAPFRSRGEVVIGSDHGGFELKQALIQFLRETGYRVRDVGTHSTEAVDYPDFAARVAAQVAKGEAWRGIMIDGVGSASGMVCNRFPGVRAAVCFDVFSTKSAREHNDAHILCMGGRVVDAAKGREMARAFLETEFGGDRHQKRVDKIMAIEAGFLRAAAGRSVP